MYIVPLGVRRCYTATLQSGSLAPSASKGTIYTCIGNAGYWIIIVTCMSLKSHNLNNEYFHNLITWICCKHQFVVTFGQIRLSRQTWHFDPQLHSMKFCTNFEPALGERLISSGIWHFRQWWCNTVLSIISLTQVNHRVMVKNAIFNVNPYPAKLIYLNFNPLEVVSRYRDPQLQMVKITKKKNWDQTFVNADVLTHIPFPLLNICDLIDK